MHQSLRSRSSFATREGGVTAQLLLGWDFFTAGAFFAAAGLLTLASFVAGADFLVTAVLCAKAGFALVVFLAAAGFALVVFFVAAGFLTASGFLAAVVFFSDPDFLSAATFLPVGLAAPAFLVPVTVRLAAYITGAAALVVRSTNCCTTLITS